MATTSELYDANIQRIGVDEGEIYEAWKLKLLDWQQFSGLFNAEGRLSNDQLRYWAAFGLLAPTTHNTVPERFLLNEEGQGMELKLDRSRILPASDANGRQALISAGAVVQNIRLAAKCYGYETKLELLKNNQKSILPLGQDNNNRYVSYANLEFSYSGRACDPGWLQAMLDRKVTRCEYKTTPLIDGAKEGMRRYVKSFDKGVDLILVDDSQPALKQRLARLQEYAMSFVINNEKFAAELGSWFLPNSDKTTSYAMRGREFGLGDIITDKLHHGLKGEEALVAQDTILFTSGEAAMMKNNSAVAILCAKDDSFQSRVETGMIYEDLVLNAARQGFVTSMHAALAEVALSNKLLKVLLKTSKRPMVIFRIGVPKNIADFKRYHSARPDLDSVILDN
jgi:hypothetical protein